MKKVSPKNIIKNEKASSVFDEFLSRAYEDKIANDRLNTQSHSNNPLQNKTLAVILEALVDHYGWDELARKIKINCFKNDPSIKSTLTFLRKTPWARDKVEALYLYAQRTGKL